MKTVTLVLLGLVGLGVLVFLAIRYLVHRLFDSGYFWREPKE